MTLPFGLTAGGGLIVSEPHILRINKSLCISCGECEKLLPKFRSVYDGIIEISEWAYKRTDVKMGVQSVMASCPVEAITLTTVLY